MHTRMNLKILFIAMLFSVAVLFAACTSNAVADEEIIISSDVWEYANQCFSSRTTAEPESTNLYCQMRRPKRIACEYFFETEQNERKRYICVLETQGDAIILLRESDDPQVDINALLNLK